MSRKALLIGIGAVLLGGALWAVAWSATQGPAMMRAWTPQTTFPTEQGQPLTLDQAEQVARNYLEHVSANDLALSEVMAFDNHFYAAIEEQDGGVHAMELLIDRFSGRVVPEPGPNMMWNAKYGHMRTPMMGGMMGRRTSGSMSLSATEARQAAQRFLDEAQPGTQAGEPDRFYGYYTLHALRDERVVGMLSVHGDNGQVWAHSWHGEYLGMRQFEPKH